MQAMYRRPHYGAAGFSAVPRRRHAVVVGGSLAGMLAARVLSDHFARVTLLERGRRALERLFPGLTGELVRAGAEPLDFTRDFAWMSPHGWYVRFPGDLLLLASTRDLIDWGVRGRVAALPNVRIRQGADVAGLIRGPGDGACVAGVRLRPRTAGHDGVRLARKGGAEVGSWSRK